MLYVRAIIRYSIRVYSGPEYPKFHPISLYNKAVWRHFLTQLSTLYCLISFSGHSAWFTILNDR